MSVPIKWGQKKWGTFKWGGSTEAPVQASRKRKAAPVPTSRVKTKYHPVRAEVEFRSD